MREELGAIREGGKGAVLDLPSDVSDHGGDSLRTALIGDPLVEVVIVSRCHHPDRTSGLFGGGGAFRRRCPRVPAVGGLSPPRK
jgi:hypothetical protein